MHGDKYHDGVPTDHLPPIREMRRLAELTGATMTMVPTSTGIGAPGTQPAPASLARSPMASSPANAPATAVPFTRGSSLATMQDATLSAIVAGSSSQVQLQTNAFLENIIVDVNMTTATNSAAVAYAADGPWNVIQSVQLQDPAGQAIISPISGYGLYLLNKYLPDTSCLFDPKQDPNYFATTGTVATGGSFGFRLVIPIEHRRRDAFGALNNSAANQRYLLTFNWVTSFVGTTNIYSTAPTNAGTLSAQLYQQYWTSPPASIVSSAGQTAVQATPSGLSTVGFVRYEQHNEVSGGGSPQIQLNNVGDYISTLIFVLRDTSSTGPRDINSGSQSGTAANWPSQFDFWVNDFQVQSLSAYGPTGPLASTGNGGIWTRMMAQAYGYKNAVETAGGLDNGVFILPFLNMLFDRIENFSPANQYLPTDATTKLQIRGSTWGSGASTLQVFTRMLRPSSGAALFNGS